MIHPQSTRVMTVKRLLAIGFIFTCTGAAWFILGSTLAWRTQSSNQRLEREVTGNWGAPMIQAHPTAYYISPTSAETKRMIQPARSRVDVSLQYDPKKKGLLWYRTYRADFRAEYVLRNPTPITQTIYVRFDFPAEGMRYDKFTLTLGDKSTDKAPANGSITESIILKPGTEVPLQVAYWAAGLNRWDYSLGSTPRVRDFQLRMKTDFAEINIPEGAESPTSRTPANQGWDLVWQYSDVIGAHSIGMDMPAVINPGPVAARITFFAPVSLLFFFSVLVLLGIVRKVNLHPMNYFFLAAGCFAFQLLFAYLVDLIPTLPAFLVAATVSLILVTGYVGLLAGSSFARLSALAQFAYMVLFSYSFFFRGLTGITITVGAVITLALLMIFTAKVDWESIFKRNLDLRVGGLARATSTGGPPPLP